MAGGETGWIYSYIRKTTSLSLKTNILVVRRLRQKSARNLHVKLTLTHLFCYIVCTFPLWVLGVTKKIILLMICFTLSFDAFAGWKTKAFFAGGALAVHAAIKSPTVRKKIIEKTIANPKLKEKAKSILTAFIKNPKNSKYADKAKEFYRQIVGVPYKINGRLPINYKYAGKTFHLPSKLKGKYPHGVPFNTQGFPDFSRYVIKQVKIKFTRSRPKDFTAADKLASLPRGYRQKNKLTWHHHQDGKTMQLIKNELHDAVKHTGGFAKGGG